MKMKHGRQVLTDHEESPIRCPPCRHALYVDSPKKKVGDAIFHKDCWEYQKGGSFPGWPMNGGGA